MSKQSVILAKICAIYDNPKFVTKSDSAFMKILKCADLNCYYIKNSKYLMPYTINEGHAITFKNPNEFYDVFKGLDNIFSDLLANHDDEAIGRLLIELGNNIPATNFDEDAEESIQRKLVTIQQQPLG